MLFYKKFYILSCFKRRFKNFDYYTKKHNWESDTYYDKWYI